MIENSLTTRRSSSFTPYSTLSTNKLWPGCWLLSVWRPSTLPLEVLFMNRCGQGASALLGLTDRGTLLGHPTGCTQATLKYAVGLEKCICFFKRVFFPFISLASRVLCETISQQLHNKMRDANPKLGPTNFCQSERRYTRWPGYPFLQWRRYRYRAYHHTDALVQDSSISSMWAMQILQSCTEPSIRY